MTSLSASKSICKHACDKCLSPGISNISLDESNISIPTTEMTTNGNSYVNTPSPSSIASTSTLGRMYKHRSLSSKNYYHLHSSSKRRYRYDRLLHHTHSFNRQYIITMTNILFHIRKEIYKLKRRTHHVEQMLAKQFQPVHPIIRIPRLTKDELSSICVNDDEIQPTVVPTISKENDLPTNDIETLNDTESSIALPTEHQIVKQQSTQKNKFCSICKHEFSHRSGYLRHVKRIHKGIFPPMPDINNPVESETSRNEETPVSTNDQSVISAEAENGIEDEFLDTSINQWGIADDRLRPRPLSKSKNDLMRKVKCDICNKFFRASYIKRHQNRTHRGSRSSSSSELNDSSDQTRSISDKPMNEPQTTADESSTNITTLASTVALAEMDIDDIPVRFRKDSSKAIVIAATCLERYQLDIIEEFLQKFPNRVTQSTTVDSRTTHLITNDDQQLLHSPLSIKLIEAIAHHCFCVSYRWIIDCLKYDRIVDENIYEIEGDTTDYHPHGGPKRSRLIEKRQSLFENICFMIKCTENSEIKMTNDRLQDLITTCGGKIITCVTQNFLEQFTVVVLCDKLYVSERRHNYDQCRSLGIRFVSSDWVLESILEYRQKPFLSYEETPL